MSESDTAYELLRDLERTLTGVRDRLADLAVLAAGPPAVVVAVPSAEELCTSDVPGPLVLPPEVEAPAVVVLPDAAEAREVAAVSAR